MDRAAPRARPPLPPAPGRASPGEAPGEEPYERAVYQVFKILAEDRDKLQKYLRERGIGSAVHYAIPMHLQTVAAEL